MIVNRLMVPFLAIALFLGVIGASVANGNWIVSGKEMVDVTHLVAGVDIKGWMTLQQVADGFGITLADVYRLGEIPDSIPGETALKDIEGLIDGFEISLLRENIDNDLAAGAGAPPPATAHAATPVPLAHNATPTSAPSPTATPDATGDDLPAAAANATPLHVPGSVGAGDGVGPTPLPPGEILAAAEIKGKHTLAEIAELAQVPLDALLAALGLPADQDPAASVRDLTSSGLLGDVDAVRSVVADLQAGQTGD